ncbi:FHA domain-containing protein [Agromyces protaetiae]|uniref:FHA domain-containing protein n=1 Tax=Agromyces protaetiae TaxID=2509455 RepID=A0A4P6FF33_9MICO|nr:FHA domain-containing protein [Agromyces protaetiae]QAY74456.1 FHA domain-containing protein [Agromyces protaetiae]
MVDGIVRGARESGAGVWDVVVGTRFIVALDSPAPDHAMAALTAAATDDRATLEGIVGCIPLGASGVASFGLVWWPPEGGPITVVVRGEGAVDLASPGGRRRLDSKGITPWHLAEFRDVTALRIGGAGSSLDALDLLGGGFAVGRRSGVVRATSVAWQASDPVTNAPEDEPSGWAASSDAEPEPRLAPRFRIGDGDAIEVAGIVRIGRSPQRPNGATGPVRLVSVGREAAEVSATHLELRREGSRLVATDLRSTNGTVLRTAAGTRRMRTGESIVVVPGTALDLGSDTIVEILPPQDDRALPNRWAPA